MRNTVGHLSRRERRVRNGETSNVEHASIRISNLTELLNLCRESPSVPENCIFRVSGTLRRPNPEAFVPKVVSIGPFHRGKDTIYPIKLWYLYCLLDRLSLPREETLRRFDESLRSLKGEKHPREYYAEPIPLNNYEFNEMMVVDGCFLIELFRKNAQLVSVHEEDPIFSTTSWMRENLYHDLILLENQIPWVVLQLLFQLTKSVHEQETHFLSELVLRFFDKRMLMTDLAVYTPRESHEIKHILDLLRSCLLSSSVPIKPKKTGWHRLPPVTDLLQAGIKFKSGTSRDIFDIKFKKGVFEIPPILIKSNSESLFWNIIACEQYDRDCTYQFTSYAVFLYYLINTSKDVDVLYDEGILRHALSTEDISLLFNGLYNDTLVYKFYYAEVSRDVYKYCKSRWTTLKRDYIIPWKIYSATAVILILTVIQTVFAILSFCFNK